MRKEGLENLSCLLPLNTKGRAVGLFEGGGGVRQVDEMNNMFFSLFDFFDLCNNSGSRSH